MEQRSGSLSGLTQTEAKEFHSLFMGSFLLFTLVAVVAHVLVWLWRPWFPPVGGYAEIQDAVQTAAALLPAYFG